MTTGARRAAAIGSLMLIAGQFFPGTKQILYGNVYLQSYWNHATGGSAILVVLGLCCLRAAAFGWRKTCRGFAATAALLVTLGVLVSLFVSDGLVPSEAYAKEYAWGMYVILAGALLLAIAAALLRKPQGETSLADRKRSQQEHWVNSLLRGPR